MLFLVCPGKSGSCYLILPMPLLSFVRQSPIPAIFPAGQGLALNHPRPFSASFAGGTASCPARCRQRSCNPPEFADSHGPHNRLSPGHSLWPRQYRPAFPIACQCCPAAESGFLSEIDPTYPAWLSASVSAKGITKQ